MSANNSGAFIGRVVSLVSASNIRYEGTIHMIDNDKITLKDRLLHWQGRIIGTTNETKPCCMLPTPPRSERAHLREK